MDLSLWLAALCGLGLVALALMAAFVELCDRV